ncbi:hypothetical protein F5J12DRAFT_786571 [Pisolithus orientalis]|uniref:uncharacterized protein n=1 Tax=Pisolithus orientalis TaxID=936130 RepID=UPI002224E327|nr:uncharacterized protein F5J12DRAFT_786571 [Pisolithus orientalis]KAI5990044.1 hypothetical protein F5J12DRAFT_786571 [Pisolithus orientalis]
MCFTVNASAWARYSVRGPPPTPADKRILEAEGHVIVAMGKPLLADALLNPMSADKKSTGILKRVVLLERVGKTRGKRNTCLTEGGPDRPSYRLAINNDGGQSRKPLLQALKHSLSIPLNFEMQRFHPVPALDRSHAHVWVRFDRDVDVRSHLGGEKSALWVCDWSFKYMAKGPVWEVHVKSRAHAIWEIDQGEILDVKVRCALGGVAHATNLRTEDAAFALAECGWLERVRVLARRDGDGNGGMGEEDKMEDGDGLEDLEHSGRTVMTITCEVVEAVARE